MKCDKILKLFKKLRSSPIFAPEFYKSIYNTAECKWKFCSWNNRRNQGSYVPHNKIQ